MTGHFFVIDGPDGAGKGTQIELLKAVLPHRYGRAPEDFVFTREPGGSPRAELIRALILSAEMKDASGFTMLHLFAAARADHVEAVIKPALHEGKVVVCDRFDGSTFAYQIWAQGATNLFEEFYTMHRRLRVQLGDWTTILFEIDADTSRERSAARKSQTSTHFDERSIAFYRNVRAGFLRYAADSPVGMHHVNGYKSICGVHQDIIAVFDRVLGGPSP